MSEPLDPNSSPVQPPPSWAVQPSLAPLPKRKPRVRSLASLSAFLMLFAVGAGWYVSGGAERAYFDTLASQNLLQEFPNREVAVLQGRAFCETMKTGADAVGYKRQKAAVDSFCPEFSQGFTVIPTPEEQQATLLKRLRESGLGGVSASDATAVATAKAVCGRLDAGGEPKGVKADAIAVDVYCPDYASGFRTLEEIVVKGFFAIYNSGYYFPTVGKYSDGSCYGRNGYSDIDEGTRVIVKNQAGKILTETQLEAGIGSYSKCRFPFTFTVLEGESKYLVTVSKRGVISYSEAELKIPGRVRLFLG